MSSGRIVAEGYGRMPKQARSIDKRERILLGAAEVFNQFGYAATSLNLIAAECGVSKGAVQFQFRTKEAVAKAVIDEGHTTVMRLAEEIVGSEASAMEQAVMLSHMMAEQLITNPIVRGGIRLTIELAFTEDSPVETFQEWISVCGERFQQAQKDGELVSGIDPVRLARHVASAFTGIQIFSHVLANREDLDERVGDMWQHLLRGILEPAQQGRIGEITAARLKPKADEPQVEHYCSTCGRLHC